MRPVPTIACLTFALLSTAWTPVHAQSERLVVLARHAERAAEPASDPGLTDAGRARAAALAETLAGIRVEAAIVTPYRRTRETAGPVAAANGIEPIAVEVRGGLAAHVAAVAEAVRARPAGATVVVVGHSNTIPRIVTALGGPELADLCETEYAKLFVLAVPDTGPARLVIARYGTPDAPDAADCRD